MVLDTNIVSAHFRGEPAVTSKIAASQNLYLPLIVLGELLYGARKSTRPDRNLERVNLFKIGTLILLPDENTAEKYTTIKVELAVAGTMIPENDIWIAALALQHKLPLISRDQHFDSVDGLDWQVW